MGRKFLTQSQSSVAITADLAKSGPFVKSRERGRVGISSVTGGVGNEEKEDRKD